MSYNSIYQHYVKLIEKIIIDNYFVIKILLSLLST